jgi:histone H4
MGYDAIQDIKKPQIARLIERVGIKRMSGLIYEESRGILLEFLQYFLKKVGCRALSGVGRCLT